MKPEGRIDEPASHASAHGRRYSYKRTTGFFLAQSSDSFIYMKPDIHYHFHHMGIPTNETREGERFSAPTGMFTSENPGNFRIQWHRFTLDSPLHPLIKTIPHAAFQVNDLQAAIEGEDVILGPFEPVDGLFVAMIDDGGVPVELIQTSLPDDELWSRAKAGKGSIYRDKTEMYRQPDAP